MTTYYFAIASQDFLLKEDPVEELLRERVDHYRSINKVIDFWLILNPTFINAPEMSLLKKQLNKPSAAIVSQNPTFITWLKLRLGFVFIGDFHAPSSTITDPLGEIKSSELY